MSDSVTTAEGKSRDEIPPAVLHVEKSSHAAAQGQAATDEYVTTFMPERGRGFERTRRGPTLEAPRCNSGEIDQN